MHKRFTVRTTLEAGVFTTWMLMMLCIVLSVIGCQPAQSLKVARSHYGHALTLEAQSQPDEAQHAYRAAVDSLAGVDTQAWQRDGLSAAQGLLGALCHWRLNEPALARQWAEASLLHIQEPSDRATAVWLRALLTHIDHEQLAQRIEHTPSQDSMDVIDPIAVRRALFDPGSGHMTRLQQLMTTTDDTEALRFLMNARLLGWHTHRRALHLHSTPPAAFSDAERSAVRRELEALRNIDARAAWSWAQRFGMVLD